MAEASRRTIAIIDDDTAVLESLQLLLEVIGHPVQAFASVEEFLKAPPWHFAGLILDHHMPQMTGLELAQRLRDNGTAIPILLVTGSSLPAVVARAAKLGHRTSS